MRALALCAALALAGCQGSVDTAAFDANEQVVLTEVAKQACEAQKLANATATIAGQSGNADVASGAALASVALGLGCTWQNAATAKPAAS